ALGLLFDLPLVVGALVTTVVSTAMLFVQDRRSQRAFERVITSLLVVVAIGFLTSLVLSPPDPAAAVAGLAPRLAGADSALLAVGMLGATVMPHAVYLHSALVRDRHGMADEHRAHSLLRAIRLDVVLAMVLAGGVNISMLLLSASALFGLDVVGLPEAHVAYAGEVGPGVALLFAVALLASGLASTSVGGYAGAVIMAGLLRRRIPLIWRRVITAVPALLLLAAGLDATRLLIISQVVLSFGIPFALLPLVRIAADRELMHLIPTRRLTLGLAWVVIALVIGLNATLLVLTAGEALA
ncbi:MAG: Nramp family divalent metal transporter, partial [Actinomycetes bacterium]